MKHIRRTHEQFPCLMAAPDESIVHRAVIHQCRTKTSKNKSSTLIYQLCSVSPPVNFFAAHSGYSFSLEQRVHVENVLQVADGVEQRIALLFTIVYCSEPPKGYWDTVCLKTLSPGVASKLLVTQATATALLTILTCGLWLQDCWADCRPRNPTAPLRSVCNLPPQELQECQGLQVQLALLLVACN